MIDFIIKKICLHNNLCIFTTPKEAARLVNGCKITAWERGDERNFLLTVVVSAGWTFPPT